MSKFDNESVPTGTSITNQPTEGDGTMGSSGFEELSKGGTNPRSGSLELPKGRESEKSFLKNVWEQIITDPNPIGDGPKSPDNKTPDTPPTEQPADPAKPPVTNTPQEIFPPDPPK